MREPLLLKWRMHRDPSDAFEAVGHSRLPCPIGEDHARQWSDIMLTKPTLATFTKRIAHKGFASKRGPTDRKLMNWKTHFLLLQYPFLSYFKSNDPETRCVGTVYLGAPCEVRALPSYPSVKHVLQIKPHVRRNLRRIAKIDDEDNFYFAFSSEDALLEWEQAIQKEIVRGTQEEFGEANSSDAEGEYAQHDDQPVALGDLNLQTAADILRSIQQTKRKEEGDHLNPSHEQIEGIVDSEAPHDTNRIGAPLVLPGAVLPFNVATKSVTTKAQRTCGEREGSIDNHEDNDDRLSSSGRSSSSVLSAKFQHCDVRRRSFFDDHEVMHCVNSAHVHRTHCCRCKVSPVAGFLYSCVVCEACDLCASCFRVEDHDPKHLFLVSPDIEGECLRVMPSCEGGPFRVAELIVLEALFRLIGDAEDGSPTRPVAKRQLVTFWNSIATVMNGEKSEERERHLNSFPQELLISEKDLVVLCRDHDLVTFAEFVFLVRCRLASKVAWFFIQRMSCADDAHKVSALLRHTHTKGKDGAFVHISIAFNILTLMLQVHQTGRVSDNGAKSLFHRIAEGNNASHYKGELSPIELSTLNMLLGACAVVPRGMDTECVPFDLYAMLIRRVLHYLGAPCEEVDVGRIVESDLPFEDDMEHEESELSIPLTTVTNRIKDLWKTLFATSNKKMWFEHGLVDVVDHVLCYEVGGALGLYSPQLESIHALCCDSCQEMPIVGYAYEEVCDGGEGSTHQDGDRAYCHSCVTNGKWVAGLSTIALQPVPRVVGLRKLPGGIVSMFDTASGRPVSIGGK